MNKHVELLRPRHLINNALVFIIGTVLFWRINGFISYNLVIGLTSFLLTYSFVYVNNDLKDLKEDQKHELSWKRNRPLPQGKVNKITAKKIMLINLTIGLTLSFFINVFFALISLLLVILNVIYTNLNLKKRTRIGIIIVMILQPLKILNGWLVNSTITNNLPVILLVIYSFAYGTFMTYYKRNKFRKKRDYKSLSIIMIIGLITSLISALFDPFLNLMFIKILIITIIGLALFKLVKKDLDKNFNKGLKIVQLINLLVILGILL